MPAKSKAQQAVFGAAESVKKGEKKLSEIQPAGFRAQVASVLKSAKKSDIKDFAETKTKHLPRKVGGGSRSQIRNVRSA